MLAAILLNLPDYQKQADGGGGRVASKPRRYINADDLPQSRTEAILTASKRLEELTEGVSTPEAAKPVRDVLPQVSEYAENNTDVQALSSLLAALAAIEFELRQEAMRENTDRLRNLEILEQVSVILTYLRDDEEAILAILLCEA